MSIRTVRCRECGETRIGLLSEGSTVPVREDCPACGSSEYVDVVEESDDEE